MRTERDPMARLDETLSSAEKKEKQRKLRTKIGAAILGLTMLIGGGTALSRLMDRPAEAASPDADPGPSPEPRIEAAVDQEATTSDEALMAMGFTMEEAPEETESPTPTELAETSDAPEATAAPTYDYVNTINEITEGALDVYSGQEQSPELAAEGVFNNYTSERSHFSMIGEEKQLNPDLYYEHNLGAQQNDIEGMRAEGMTDAEIIDEVLQPQTESMVEEAPIYAAAWAYDFLTPSQKTELFGGDTVPRDVKEFGRAIVENPDMLERATAMVLENMSQAETRFTKVPGRILNVESRPDGEGVTELDLREGTVKSKPVIEYRYIDEETGERSVAYQWVNHTNKSGLKNGPGVPGMNYFDLIRKGSSGGGGGGGGEPGPDKDYSETSPETSANQEPAQADPGNVTELPPL